MLDFGRLSRQFLLRRVGLHLLFTTALATPCHRSLLQHLCAKLFFATLRSLSFLQRSELVLLPFPPRHKARRELVSVPDSATPTRRDLVTLTEHAAKFSGHARDHVGELHLVGGHMLPLLLTHSTTLCAVAVVCAWGCEEVDLLPGGSGSGCSRR